MTRIDSTQLRLWYRQPAPQWDHALPIGNGRLGAMIFGRIEDERIQLNEDTLWSGGPVDANNPKSREHLDAVRRLLREGKPVEASELAEQTMLGDPRRIRPYQTLGDLLLHFPGHAEVEDYRLELDLESAVVRVSYRVGEAMFTREAFASYPGDVIVVRIACDRPGHVTFDAALRRDADAVTDAVEDHTLALTGQLDEGRGMKVRAELRVRIEGGMCEGARDRLAIRSADAATLIFGAATDYRGDALQAASRQALDAAMSRTFDELRADHVADHQALFHRVTLDLGPEVEALAA